MEGGEVRGMDIEIQKRLGLHEDSTSEIIEQTKGISRDGSGRLKIIVPGLPGSTEDNQQRNLAPAYGVSYM